MSKDTSAPFDFDDRSRKLVEVWDILQRIQCDFCFPQELGVYYGTEKWLASQTVLDIGTGNGHYLGRLASRFTDKTYLGVDIEPRYIEIARRRVTSERVRFERAALSDVGGRYDFVILRLLMQHLDRPELALKKLTTLLRPGGAALIVDALDPVRYFYPEPVGYMEFFQSYKEQQLAQGMDRDIARRLDCLVSEEPLLRMKRAHEIVVPSTLHGNLELFEQTYYLVIEMVELKGNLDYDFAATKAS